MPRQPLFFFLLLGFFLTPLFAQEESPEEVYRDGALLAEDGLVRMNFQDVEIGTLAQFISEITGKNFVVDEKVRGRVTVISPTRITPEAAYKVFESALQVKGLTAVPNGAVIKIVPTREARQTGLPTLPLDGVPLEGDAFVTRLVPLRHVDAVEMAAILQPMVSSDGLVVPYAPTNHLILTDAASNLQRLLGIVKALDVQGQGQTTEVVPLKYARAEDLAEKIAQVLQSKKSSVPNPSTKGRSSLPLPELSPQASVLADERTNALIVQARAKDMEMARKLIAELDVPLSPGKSRIHVYYLKNASAEEMLPVLGELLGSTGFQGPENRQSGQPSGPSPISRRSYGQRRPFAAPALSSRRNREKTPPTPAVAGLTPEFSGEVRIAADPATNALLISAAPQDFATLKQVLEKLDVRRRQVYVEALILEVSVDRFRQLGIELQGEVNLNHQGVGIGRVNLRDLNAALTNPASLSGLLLAAVSNRTVEIPDGAGGFVEVPAKIALLRAAQTSTDINVLSAPTILTTDNEEAEILVGQNVPLIASRATDTTQLENLFATVERQDVGIRLLLTPQISEGDLVRLDLYEEVSTIVPTTVGDPNLVGPTISVRSASTTVVVRDGQTVAIGGLISDNTLRSESKVPFLGDVPVLGNLFRSRDDQTGKINLLIFLTPHIIRNETDMAALAEVERKRFKRFLKEHRTPPRWQEQLERPSFAPPPPRP